MKNRKKTRSGQNILPLILIVLGLILIGGVLAWQSLGMGQANTSQNQSPSSEPPSSDIPFSEIERVSLEEAKAAYDDQSAVFLDVRSEESFNQGHIPGAVHIPLSQLESRAGELDPNEWIITYCT